jgi:hypothetical protein
MECVTHRRDRPAGRQSEHPAEGDGFASLGRTQSDSPKYMLAVLTPTCSALGNPC